MQRLSFLEKADLLLAISEYSADEGRRLLKKFSGDIANIRGGIDQKFCVLNEGMSVELLNKYNINRPFLLYTASFDHRKNQEGLIRAFAQLPAALRESHQLVIVGNGWPDVYNRLHTIGRQAGLQDNSIIFTGRVQDEELVDLYRNCKLFVFPSFWEGLGLPVIEAMACGAPVIGSYTTSLPEFLADPEAGFDPSSSAAIAERMEHFLSNEKRLNWLREKGIQHAREFTWERSAATAMEALRRTADKARKTLATKDKDEVSSLQESREKIAYLNLSDKDKRIAAFCLASNEIETERGWVHADSRKVGWVTTWNKRCGVASYSKNIIQHVQSRPIVFCQKEGDLEFSRKGIDVLDVLPTWNEGKGDDLHELTTAIKSRQVDEVIIQFNYGLFNFQYLATMMQDLLDSGIAVFITMHSTTDPVDKMDGFELAELVPALRKATGIFVHTEKDIRNLADRGICHNVKILPQGVQATAYGSRTATRAPKRIMASYGFFLPGKGFPQLIEATHLLLTSGVDVHLKMVNADYNDTGGVSRGEIELCKSKIRELGIEKNITIIDDYLEDEDSIRHLREADVVVFPYQKTGESSSAAVRTGLSSGVPVAVTPLSVFDDVADVVHILPGTKPEELAAGIKEVFSSLKSKTTTTRQIAERAERWRAAHSFSNIAEYLEKRMLALSFGSHVS
ncbi:hypothetical protein ATN84_00505 [Paramesorhizobium deserti]|uniref:Glycosyl transferase family 1 domain-containing protein n=2 Tax=Paramesorhizobium deserti TaxID=1494590 RepID=A0A135HYN0_9HYPH|nr:hypothetical protein ATN84_00505 [Paramesorhizobium deserti]